MQRRPSLHATSALATPKPLQQKKRVVHTCE